MEWGKQRLANLAKSTAHRAGCAPGPLSHLLLEQLYFLDTKIPVAMGWCKQPGRVLPAIKEEQLWEWSMLTHGTSPVLAGTADREGSRSQGPCWLATCLRDHRWRAVGCGGRHPLPVSTLHTELQSSLRSLGLGIWPSWPEVCNPLFIPCVVLGNLLFQGSSVLSRYHLHQITWTLDENTDFWASSQTYWIRVFRVVHQEICNYSTLTLCTKCCDSSTHSTMLNINFYLLNEAIIIFLTDYIKD